MSLPLAYRAEARDEIDAAYAWYEQQRPGLGDKFLAALHKTVERIEGNPEMYGVAYRKIRGAPVRRYPYVVYYKIEEERILVVAVQYGGRNPSVWRGRA